MKRAACSARLQQGGCKAYGALPQFLVSLIILAGGNPAVNGHKLP
jgi:hypothetical protein